MWQSAEEWDRFDRVPVANENAEEGIRYFLNHYFVLEEDEEYGPISDLSGYSELPGGRDAWRLILERWENEFASTLSAWEGRIDFKVNSAARRRASRDADVIERDIRSSMTNVDFYDPKRGFGLNTYLDWAKLRKEVHSHVKNSSKVLEDPMREPNLRWKYESHRLRLVSEGMDSVEARRLVDELKGKEEEGDERRRKERFRAEYPQVGRMIDREVLDWPRLRVHSSRFTRSIDASILHEVNGGFYEAMVQGAQLVAWVESEMVGNELAWRWLGAVYSWKNCQIHPISRCSEQAQADIVRLVTPLVREWAHLLRESRHSEQSLGTGGSDPFDRGFRI